MEGGGSYWIIKGIKINKMFVEATQGEKKLLEILKGLKPYEEVRIVADKDGKPDTFFVSRSSKVIVSGIYITPIK